jgi:hypothetical protein
MEELRRSGGAAEWHWSESCMQWPMRNFERRKVRPSDGPFCKHCKEIDPR